ncbi:ubiquitin binding protein [Neolentinus lepideus HHB14362 ss-1]|uniref:Vacuolar protein sorting-associated protein 27 n=1 Tax=Neolentinus lepideus HHB14362 ss-1 TaxID=1314782 RepID=A0A165S5Z6_9AGAM|nr:ubiquitin binding protein [Neolentinus lepideus HHB14362 ss-1]
MSGLTSWLWGTSQVDEAIDKATSDLLPAGSEDIALNLEICDQIRSKAVPPKDAMKALKRRLNHKNPNVQLLALGLTDVCIKNGGDHFLVEIASREFMDNLVSILKMPTLNHEVKNKILRLVQNWSIAFEGRPALSYVGQVYKALQAEGFNFPPKDFAITSSAIIDTQTAPEWIDSDVCLRCRTPFTFTNRKHHCRNCGQVFDQACSSKTMPLPHFGITQEVRICDGCYNRLLKSRDKPSDNKGHRNSSSRHRSGREFEDAELQRAIQLSLQEVGAAGGHRPGYVPSQPASAAWQPSSPPLFERSSAAANEEDDPDLKAAIEASLREAQAPRPSAPIVASEPQTLSYEHTPSYASTSTTQPHHEPLPNYDLEPLESDAILTFSQTMDQVQTYGGGRDISRFPAVSGLYDKASGLRPKLAQSLDDTVKREQMLTEMHDKLSEAVKLYDQILTRQVSHPPWRTSTAPAPTATPYAAQPQLPTDAYSHWRPSQPAQASPMSPVYQQAPAQPTYAPSASSEYEAPTQSYGSPVGWQQPPVSVMSLPPMSPAQLPQAPPEPVNQHPWQSYQQQLVQPQQYAPAPPITSSVYANGMSPYGQPISVPSEPSTPSFDVTPKPISVPLPQSPPPPPQQPHIIRSSPSLHSRSPSVPSLSRHNTVTSYSTVSSPPAAINASLSRHNTTHSQPYAQQSYQQHGHHASLPSFPIVPTAPPAMPAYGSGLEQEERKEALLIDL